MTDEEMQQSHKQVRVLEQVGELAVWSDSGGSWFHERLGSRIRVAFQGSLAELPKERASRARTRANP
jgi:hypothetical protein